VKTKQKLAVIATGAFILSFFLPAWDNDTGLVCFNYCLGVMLKEGPEFLQEGKLGGWMYDSGFVVANLLFLVLATLLMMSARDFYRTRRWVAVVVALQVLSWLAVNVQDLSVLRSGYYMWLGAYVLLFFVHVLNRNEINQTTGQL
jgi:hypothetical protein